MVKMTENLDVTNRLEANLDKEAYLIDAYFDNNSEVEDVDLDFLVDSTTNIDEINSRINSKSNMPNLF